MEHEQSKLHYLEWGGPPRAPTLVLVHGFMGHAHWWDFVAPALAESYRVVALDLPGMGDSQIPPPYSLDANVARIGQLIRSISSDCVTLIGHSYGGRCTILTAYAHPELLNRAIAIDSHVSFPRPDSKSPSDRPVPRAHKRYATLDEAISRFRLVPDEEGTPPRIFEHIARHALKQDADGWSWKFDPEVMNRGPKPAVSDARALPLLRIPLDYVCGQWSRVVSSEHAAQIASAISRGRAPIVIPGGYHHLPIGQPIALAAVLRALLADEYAG